MVNYSDRGGAARAAFRLRDALADAGVAGEMRLRSRGEGHGLRAKAGWALQLLQRPDDGALRSANLLPSGWARQINRSDADIVHLHWVGNDTLSIEDIGRIGKPVVWTLHDMWAFCGSEHLAETGPAARWRQGYRRGNRPPGFAGLDLDRMVWERKRSAWRRPVFLAAPSRWLAGCALSSALLSGWPCRVIPNVLDTAKFAPQDRLAARRETGLPERGPIVLFGGGAVDRNKGYDLLVAALEAASRSLGRPPVCVALGDPPPDPSPIPIRWLGRIDDDARLALLYSAADVAVVPSRLENLPQAATEAQSCGCPVVAFDVGGLADAVEHEVTGFLAPPHDAFALGRGLAWVLGEGDLRERCRERALRLWSAPAVIPQYLELYRAALAARV